MIKKQWYEELFQNYAENYDREPYTKGTTGEVDFIEQEIHFNRDLKILDIGCGTGRHAIELAKRGYTVTGIDLSDAQVIRAREKAVMENVKVNFQQADARILPFSDEYDLAIMICEGGFSLMETDEMNYAILKSAYTALKTNGKLIFTCLNALFPLFHSVKDFMEKNDQKSEPHTFDLMTLRDISTFEFTDDAGETKTLSCNERYFLPSEITWYLQSLRFKNIGIYGCKLGNFSRNDLLATEDFEMLVVAEKS
jgi:ubiquinone/menaquinone biosynthesis C-methylase UbiE